MQAGAPNGGNLVPGNIPTQMNVVVGMPHQQAGAMPGAHAPQAFAPGPPQADGGAVGQVTPPAPSKWFPVPTTPCYTPWRDGRVLMPTCRQFGVMSVTNMTGQKRAREDTADAAAPVKKPT